MKTKFKSLMTMGLSIALCWCAMQIVQAQEADTNLTTIAYWKMNQLSTNIPYADGPTIGIPDLATNTGQGVLTGNAPVSAPEDDLYVWGDIQTDLQVVGDAPPGSMFNRGFNSGGASWNAAHNIAESGSVFFPQDQFGNEFIGPSFTEEIFFKSAGPNANKQTLIWNHQSSAYAHLQINEDGDTGDLTFWGYDGSNIQAVRVSNNAGRFDDGNWHCAVCRYDSTSKLMSLYVINQDGSSVSNAITLTADLNPEGAGNLIIGNDETSTTPFDGEINQVRLSSVALPNSALLAVPGSLQNPHIIAYWQMNNANTTPSELFGQPAILDLATNSGQGMLNGSASDSGVSASVDNLAVEGPLSGNIVFSSTVPPMSMFNTSYPYSNGTASWDAGQLEPGNGDVAFPYDVYGDELSTPSYTEEIFFKSDTTTTNKQTLLFNHHTSAYCILQINEDGTNGDLTFFSYNGGFPAIRLTTAANGGHRFDDGNWHYVACRFDAGTTNMSLYVLNQDGTYLFQSLQLTAPLTPGGPGYTIIGNDETDTFPFDGLINQVRISDVALSDGELLGVPPPPCIAPVVINPPVSITNYINDVANFSVNAAGSSLQYQWQFNGTNIIGQTNQSLSIFPVETSDAGNYTVVVSTPCGLSTTSSPPATLTVISTAAPVVNIARWNMEAQVTTTNTAGIATFQGIFDSDIISGQGIYSNGGVLASEDDLITFNGAGGNIALSNSVPPAGMFTNGNTGGSYSYDASAISNVDGALFFPQDQYGNEFSFQTGFSVELFFKTYGDQSASDEMELLYQGDGFFRYGLIVNEAGPGSVRFAVNNGRTIQTVDLTNANYADGNWHYALAQYNAVSNSITLTVVNQDGSDSMNTVTLPDGFSPLPSGDDGNLFIGRNTYNDAADGGDPRTFIGLIDEVQISSGLVSSSTGQLGFVPAIVTPHVTSISVSGGTVTIKFTGSPTDPASAFTLMGSPTVAGTYSALSATITSSESGNFQATVAVDGSIEFYKIKR